MPVRPGTNGSPDRLTCPDASGGRPEEKHGLVQGAPFHRQNLDSERGDAGLARLAGPCDPCAPARPPSRPPMLGGCS